MKWAAISIVLIAIVFRDEFGMAEEPEPVAKLTGSLPNVIAPTFGSKQFWGDVLHFHGWRIQQNTLTGHYRLLDEKNYRHAWGSYDTCRGRLDVIKQERNLPAMSGKAVILLHGLVRTRGSLDKLGDYLRDRGGYTVLNVSYPSTQGTVDEHAEKLARIMETLTGVDEIHIVAHSLGNLVVRHYLADAAQDGEKPDPRIRRMVMLGPPNNGSKLAQRLSRSRLFKLITGGTGHQLSQNWQELEDRLATPEFEFGIIAGGTGSEEGNNPLVEGDDDLVVSVESTRLAGATDFRVLPVKHTFMMDDPVVMEYTLRFLTDGYFVSEEDRQPLTTVD